MQGIKQRSSKLFYQFSLEEAIPADHSYRHIEGALDLRFLYRRTRDSYGRDGQKSIDPVVFKLCLLGYFNNIQGDRGLIRYCSDSLAARWFLGYDIDEALPSIVQSHAREHYSAQVHEDVFRQALGAGYSTRGFLIPLYGHLNYHPGQINYLGRLLSEKG